MLAGMEEVGELRVREALERVLRSAVFAQSERQKSLLRFLVESTLKEQVPKEAVIGVEVYGRGPDFEPKSDSIVRVEVSRLRQRLAAYYVGEGKGETIRFELPRGSYRCQFVSQPEQTAPPAVSGVGRRHWHLVVLAGVALSAILAAAARYWPRSSSSDRDLAPYLEAHRLLNMPVDAETQQRVVQAVNLLEDAAKRETNSARIQSALGEAYLSLADYDASRFHELSQRAGTAARAAIRLDEASDGAHHTLGASLFFGEWKLAEALAEFRRAAELNPRRAATQRLRADVLCILGRFEEALTALNQAQVLEPAQLEIGAEKALVLYHWRRFGDAEVEARRTLSIHPEFAQAHWVLGLTYQQQGRLKEAAKEFRSLPARPRRYGIAMAHLLASTGRRAEAETLAHQMEGDGPYPYLHVILNAAVGDRAAAMEWLERACSQRDLNVLYAKLDPRLDGLRNEPGFRTLQERLGLAAGH